MRRGFTLLEVNLAIFIMATGTLAMCALYALGFRESNQSVEDVAAAAFADAYLGPLVQGLSATNMTWQSWREIGDLTTDGKARWPKDGWMAYVQQPTDTEKNPFGYRIKGNPKTTADGVFNQVRGKCPSPYQGKNPGIPSDYQYGLVVTRDVLRSPTVVQLAFRVARRKEALMSQPLFVSEVRFQGVVE